MYYKLLSSGLLIVALSILMIIAEQPSLAQQELNTTVITNSNATTTNTTSAPTINQTELDEWFNSLPDGTYGTIVDSHNFNSSNYAGEDYSNSVDVNSSLISFECPNV
jgi:hypothetical protein